MEALSVMNILAHTASRPSAIAAQTIQRAWRSTPAFTSQLRAEARENASQMGSEPFGRDSLTGNYDHLNFNHSFWRWRGLEPHAPIEVEQKISFADECSVRTDVDGTAPTDFHNTPDKSSRLFANTIVSLFGGDKPLYKIFSHRNAPAMEPHFKDAICKLEAGQKVSIWDGHSTKLQATDRALSSVKECFVKYNYFMKSFGQPVQWAKKVTSDKPPVCMMKPLKNKVIAKPSPVKPIGLARLAPRKVAGVVDQRTKAEQVPSVDELEERFRKIKALPYTQ